MGWCAMMESNPCLVMLQRRIKPTEGAIGSVGKIKICLHTTMAHQADAFSGLCNMIRLGTFLLSLDGILVHRRAIHSIRFIGTPFLLFKQYLFQHLLQDQKELV